MNIDEIVEQLEQIHDDCIDKHGHCDADFDLMKTRIRTLLEQYLPQWIPVSERLPSLGIAVLALGDYGDHWVQENQLIYDGIIGWIAGKGKITHWQPLPEKPEEL